MINILIIDNHTSLRTTLHQMLDKESGINVLYTVDKAASKTALMKWEDEVDVVLMDVNLSQGEPDGLVHARFLREKYPFLKVIMYSFHKVGAYIYHLYRLGVHAYLFKDSQFSHLVEAIRTVKAGHLYYEGAVKKRMENYIAHLQTQSDREVFVTTQEQAFLQLIREGNSPEEIISANEVNAVRMITHWSNITLKFGTQNVATILQASYEKGWIN